MGARSEDSYSGGEDEDEYLDEDEDYMGKKKRGKSNSNKKPRKSQKTGGNKKWENAFDDKGNDPNEPKPEKKKRVPKPKVV